MKNNMDALNEASSTNIPQELYTKFIQLESCITVVKNSFKTLQTMPFSNVEERVARYAPADKIEELAILHDEISPQLANGTLLTPSQLKTLESNIDMLSQKTIAMNQLITSALTTEPSISNHYVPNPKLYSDETHHLKMLFNPVKPAPRPDKDNPELSLRNSDRPKFSG